MNLTVSMTIYFDYLMLTYLVELQCFKRAYHNEEARESSQLGCDCDQCEHQRLARAGTSHNKNVMTLKEFLRGL